MKIRKVIAASSAGFFLCGAICALTLFARNFLEKSCRIEFRQTMTILLIELVLAAPLLVIFTRWSARIGRKWLIPGGILLAIVAWVFLFRRLPAIVGTAGRAELTEQKEIRSTVAFIGKSRDMSRTTATFTHFADGMQVAETKADTVFADGRISAAPRTILSNTLNNSDYWKIVTIFFVVALSVSMVAGPIAGLFYTLAIRPKGRTFAHVD
jgi:hypothetical protein